MPVLRNNQRDVTLALVFGLGALTLNLTMHLLGGGSWPPLGNVFLFASSLAFGLRGAIVAFAIGVTPTTLYFSEWGELLRMFAVCTTLGLTTERFSRFPAQMAALALWAGIFLPAAIGSPSSMPGFLNASSFLEAVLLAVQEIVLVTICSAALLNPYIYGALTGKSRQPGFGDILMHAFNLLVAIVVFAVLLAAGPLDVSHPAGEVLLLSVIAMCFVLPTLAAIKLERSIMGNFHQYFSATLMRQNMRPEFSGLSSDFWRRKTLTDLRSLAPEPGFSGHPQSALRSLSTGPHNSNAICALNRNGTIAFVNEGFRQMAGLPANDPIGRMIDSVGMSPELARQLMELVESTFTSGPRVMEFKLNQLPAKLRYFELSSRKAETAQREGQEEGPDSVLITMRDITDRRAVESHLLQAQRLSSLGAAIGGIAHAFNNSLTAISGYASYARQIDDLGQIHDSLNGIVLSVNKAGDMVHKLLDYAEGNPTPMKLENLGEAIKSRLDLLRKIVGEGCEVVFNMPQSPVGSPCDMNLIMQALTNLVLNAKEAYGEKSGQVEISLDSELMDEAISYLHIGAKAGKYTRLQVKDHGLGMSRETLARAFDPLFTTKTESGHTGIGLSIVYAIIRAHDGFLSAESHPEKGTTVSIYLPFNDVAQQEAGLTKASEIPAPLTSPVPAELRGNDETILVVEDEPYVRELVERMLRTLGYRVAGCADGQEALEKQRVEHFDLVLVDMIMPRMNGLELVARMRDSSTSTRALMMTGYGALPGKTDSGTEVIPKPFDLDTLARAIKNSLGRKALESTHQHFTAEAQ